MKNLFSSAKNDKYFRTDHLKDDLKRRSVRGGAVTMIAQLFKFSLNLGSNLVLARLLTPQDYGLIGMATAVTGFVTLFKDLGLSMATVQKDEITHEQVSNLFWVNLALSVTTALIAVAIAPGIAWFYHEPRLIWITLALAIGFIIGGLGVQHSALLNRQMQYKVLMFNDVLSMLLGIASAMVAAWYGLGYWALVIMPLVSGIVSTSGLWIACSWRPGLPKRRNGTRTMLAFGGHLTGFSTVNYFARNLDNVLIGRYWGAQQLGLYAKAYQLLLLPLSQINAPISAVAVPTLSRLQSNPQQFRNYYLKALSIVVFLTMPIITFMVVASEEIIGLLLGSQWSGAILLFRLLSISALFQPVCNTSGWLYISIGRSDRMFKWGVLSSSLIVASFFIGLPYGASGVALSYAIVMLLQTSPCIYYATRRTSITILDVLQSVKQTFISSLVAGAVVFGIKIAIGSSLPIWTALIIYSVVMSLIYLLFMFYIFKMKSFYLGFLREFKK
ncbi:lipopolysaccharide biosynthesis protein [Hassallia byssoidea VB512170]|uniref:Lipopolysaccharide biosynthesis protein n=1 Tax=Hassallia byssoidea VB512170 TaxID=1304833 RepID=A0A846HJ67_9CYAN|nr:lipopolysaccharide biosynthesis protein [Hassalia byssoidea]NEU76754.1 lipopolysaccharide biosynthesis protein [Hassalia byssoidea VB512170]